MNSDGRTGQFRHPAPLPDIAGGNGDGFSGRERVEKRELGIYVHIPFCVRKCAYCDFLSFPADEEIRQRYFHVLGDEIASSVPEGDYEAVSVYFGGGTPSLPDPAQITETLDAVRRAFDVRDDAEITIECNPGTLNRGKLDEYRRAGFNRLSIGLQSCENRLLKTLGRIHTFEEFQGEYDRARGAGFDNISVDLMYGLPGQTLSDWENTLRRVMLLRPEHISAYSLIVEEGTDFWERYHEDDETKRRGEKPLFLPDEETEDRMLGLLRSSLRDIGMYRYEISNYALPGRESRHNMGYWMRREYAGFGLGASGQTGRIRYRNRTCLKDYLQSEKTAGWTEEKTVLTQEDEISETMILGLRLTRGVDLQRFEERFHRRAEELFCGPVDRFTRAGLMEISDHHLRLTDRGFDVSNLVMCEFLM